jgi:hypothetical protein
VECSKNHTTPDGGIFYTKSAFYNIYGIYPDEALLSVGFKSQGGGAIQPKRTNDLLAHESGIEMGKLP